MGKENNPLISVIIPIYKVEKYLDSCICSIVNQDYQNLDIILVDDGSPDMCPKLCDQWKTRDSRIRVIHKKNGGLSSARNAGIIIAKGKYLSFVDSDDYIGQGMYTTMVEAAERNSAEIVCCGRYLTISESIKVPRHCLDQEKIYTNEQAMKEVLLARDIEEAAWDTLYRAELFNDIRYPKGEINEDIVVIFPLLKLCNRIVHVGNPFYYYRVNKNSITKSGYNEKKYIYLKHIQQVKAYITLNYPKLETELRCFMARYSYAELLDMENDKKIIQKFKNDYVQYKSILLHTFKSYISLGELSFKDRTQVLLILLGIYGPLIRTKKKLFN